MKKKLLKLVPLLLSLGLVTTSCELKAEEDVAAENLRNQGTAYNNLQLTLKQLNREDLNGACRDTPDDWFADPQEFECTSNNPLGYAESWLCPVDRDNSSCRIKPEE